MINNHMVLVANKI